MKPRFQAIQPGEQESFVVFRRATNEGFGFNWHRHPELELTLIERGRGRRFVGDHIGEYESGDLVLLGSNLPHTWRSETGTGHLEFEGDRPSPNGDRPSKKGDRPSEKPKGTDHLERDSAIVVQFRPDFMGSDFLERPELLQIRTLFERASGGLLFAGIANADDLRSDMASILAAQGFPRVLALFGLLTKLAAASPDAPVLSSPAYTAATISELADDRIARVCRFIMLHIEQSGVDSATPAPAELSLARAAAEAGMAPASFSRFFRRATGRTFISYVNELRIGRACRLLLETELTITEIAYRVGFNNLSNFNRRFRQIRDQAPREYRAGWRRQ